MQRANVLIGVLLLMLGGLQYRLWFGDACIMESRKLQDEILAQRRENEHLAERNRLLMAEVAELKRGKETIEERARNDLGMIRQDETLYQINR